MASFWTGKGFTLLYDRTRLYIRLTPYYLNKFRGLCGTFNLQSHDDFTAASGIVESDIKLFADSYKLDADCASPIQKNPCEVNLIVSVY